MWLIIGIFLVYCILVQADRLDAAHRDYAAVAGRLAKAELLLEGEDWPTLLEAERGDPPGTRIEVLAGGNRRTRAGEAPRMRSPG